MDVLGFFSLWRVNEGQTQNEIFPYRCPILVKHAVLEILRLHPPAILQPKLTTSVLFLKIKTINGFVLQFF